MSIVVALCFVGLTCAARVTPKQTLLAVHRGPDEDHLVAEIHDNAEYKDPAQKPKNTLDKLFATMDLNGDQKLSSEELMFQQYATGCEPMEAQVRATDYFRCGDSDKDGMISKAEFNQSTEHAWAH